MHISYYDLEFSKKIVINTENNIISITNGVYKELVNNRKNPFVHNSESRKPKSIRKDMLYHEKKITLYSFDFYKFKYFCFS